jgi:hypothetical protein
VLAVALVGAEKPPACKDNAAVKYLQASAALHQVPMPWSEVAPLLKNWRGVPLDRRVDDLVTAADSALRELHHGSAIEQCDWRLSLEDGLATDTSHRGAARELCALACLSARLRFRAGRDQEAIDDLLAAMTLSRHLSNDTTLASVLIAHTMEQGPVGVLAAHLPGLAPKELDRLALRIDALPAGAVLAESLMSHERISRAALLGEVRTARDRDDLLARLKGTALQAQAPAFLAACDGKWSRRGSPRRGAARRVSFLVGALHVAARAF